MYYPGYPAAGYPPGYPAAAYGQPPPGSPAPGYGYSGYGYGGVPASQTSVAAAQAAAYPGYGQTASAPSRPAERLIVSGCRHETVGGIVRGDFALTSENHGKPVYKRNGQVNGLDVMLYFWDDRDGPNFCGWWFGPKVGGDQVWAYHPEKAGTPPLSGWKVPYDGPVDNTFILQPSAGSSQYPAPGQPAGAAPVPHPQQPPGYAPQPYPHPHAVHAAHHPYGHPAYGMHAAAAAAYGYGHMPGMPPGYDHQAAERQRADRERDSKRRDEDDKRKQQNRRDDAKRREEEAKKKKEAEQKAKDEAVKQKKEAEEKRRQEQKATLAVRRIIQKVRLATPDNIDEIQKELEDVLAQELENCGTQKARIKEESDKGLEQAKKRIETLMEQRKKEQEKKEAEEKKRREQEEKVKGLVQELSNLVDAAEGAVTKLKEVSAPLSEQGDCSIQEVEQCAVAAEQAGVDTKTAIKACTDFILARGPEMKDPTPPPLPAQLLPGQLPPASETKQILAKLLQRINDTGKSADSLILTARGAKQIAVRRAAARQKTREIEAIFNKYDKDKDKLLSQLEVRLYAKNEMSVIIDKDLMDRLWRCAVIEGEKGVPLERMYLLRASLGIAREMQRNEKRRATRIAKEKVVAALREKLRLKVKEVEVFAQEMEKDLVKVEEAVAPLLAQAKSTPLEEMDRESERCDKLIKASKDYAEKVKQRVKAIPQGFDKKYEEELRETTAVEAKHLNSTMGRTDMRLQRVAQLCARYQEQAAKRKARNTEKIRAFAMKVVRQHARVKGLSHEELFAEFNKNGKGEITEKEFLAFFESVDKEVKEEVFEDEAEKTEDGAEKSAFGTEAKEKAEAAAAASMLKAAQPKSMPGPPSQQPAPPKVLPPEPVELNATEVKRFFAAALEQGATKMSKKVFLRLVTVFYKVVKETPMTESLVVEGSKTVRQLRFGEVLECLEGPCKEDSMKVFRARARVLGGDDKEGWVTVAGNTGINILQEGAHLWKALRQVQLSASFEDLAPIGRRLREGEVLEILEWPRKHEESGLMRMQVKAKIDGATGWMDQINKEGVVLADPM
eukprot:TRINITY_DN11318_c0_g2_i1.p1 TRINITY_DN11318_c0_g2~~TRINITY_DN11318_c0_g2_i1.p1  ORF type:complete len:1067 (+),score=292.64 TRINITY_DN11318_c0_g2_i1:81-3281(+)